MGWPTEFTPEVRERLLQPFEDGIVQWREGKFAFIEARDVMSRLDEVVGPGGWEFRCELIHSELGEAAVKGSLTVLGVTREDVGEHKRASQNDRIEVYKAAVSDALKRAAVHFGIARYLYELDNKRAGMMTPAERDAAARRAGYTGEGDPEVHDYPCSQCGADVPWDQVKASRRKFNSRVVCSRCADKLSDPPEPAPPKETPVSSEPLVGPPLNLCETCGTALTRSEVDCCLQAGSMAYCTAHAPGRPKPRERQGDALECSAGGCGKPLTKGQHDVSLRSYGVPLCPPHQKQFTRIG